MTVTVERMVLAADGSAFAATTATHALFLARVLDAPLQAIPATGTPQSSATETTKIETAGAFASAAFGAEEVVSAVTRRALLAGIRPTSGAIGEPAVTTVVLDIGGDNEAWPAGYRATGTAASRVVRHARVPTLVVPPSVGNDDTSGSRGRR